MGANANQVITASTVNLQTQKYGAQRTTGNGPDAAANAAAAQTGGDITINSPMKYTGNISRSLTGLIGTPKRY